MGDHRSGTTLLYQLLNATRCFTVITAYHVIRHGEVLSNFVNQAEARAKQQLRDYFAEIGLTNRLMDGVEVTPELPEEYGFTLRGGGARPQLRPGNLAGFIELCRKVQFVSEAGRSLLLKNPWDYLNFMYVKDVFPDARFIFIHRHPLHVISSQLKALRSLFAAVNPYVALIDPWYAELMQRPVRLFITRFLFSSHFELGLRLTTRHVARATAYFLQHVGSLPRSGYVGVKYEDLCEAPEATIAAILKFLDLKPKTNVAYAAWIRPRPLDLEPEVARRYERLRRRLQSYMVYCGYQA
jgi:hypothetical protein